MDYFKAAAAAAMMEADPYRRACAGDYDYAEGGAFDSRRYDVTHRRPPWPTAHYAPHPLPLVVNPSESLAPWLRPAEHWQQHHWRREYHQQPPCSSWSPPPRPAAAPGGARPEARRPPVESTPPNNNNNNNNKNDAPATLVVAAAPEKDKTKASSEDSRFDILAQFASECVAAEGTPPAAAPPLEEEEKKKNKKKKKKKLNQEIPRPTRVSVGTRLEVHTYPNNDDLQEPRWFPATVTSVTLLIDAAAGKQRTETEIVYDEEPSWVDKIVWPDEAKDVRLAPVDRLVDARPCDAEIDNMLEFFVLQLRAEYAEIVAAPEALVTDDDSAARCGPGRVAAYLEFDRELGDYEKRAGGGGPVVDVVASEALMLEFLTGKCARGDKWMPWHAALGTHERYLLSVVYHLPALETPRDKYVLGYAFSGSRNIDLFETLLRPLFEETASREDRALGRMVLVDPASAFERDGVLHRRYLDYRAEGKKLHTTSYSCHPPRGSSGEEFVYYVVDRTRRFVEIGHRAFDVIEDHVPSFPSFVDVDAANLRAILERTLMTHREIGPTMAKMFLVSTHLAYPALGILDSECTVGDGADAAFNFLFPTVSARSRADARATLLDKLYHHLHNHCTDLLPRLEHMLAWVTRRARKRFSPLISEEALRDKITFYDLQVNLCEWRKFRSTVDTTRALCSTAAAAANRLALPPRPEPPCHKKKRRSPSSPASTKKPATAGSGGGGGGNLRRRRHQQPPPPL